MTVFTYDVGYTVRRPVVVDEQRSRVEVLATSHTEGMDIAALMTGCRKGVEMVTSTRYIE